MILLVSRSRRPSILNDRSPVPSQTLTCFARSDPIPFPTSIPNDKGRNSPCMRPPRTSFQACLCSLPTMQLLSAHTQLTTLYLFYLTMYLTHFTAVVNSDVVHAALSVASAKLQKDLKKTDGAKRTRLVGIQKLDDANDAGGRYSADCTLILTEGDSAKTLAVSTTIQPLLHWQHAENVRCVCFST
jgi:hypothetical protein